MLRHEFDSQLFVLGPKCLPVYNVHLQIVIVHVKASLIKYKYVLSIFLTK